MQNEKLVDLIKSLETYSAKNRSAYRFRVALLAALGYAYLLLIVLLLLGIVAAVLFSGHFNFITIKILWIPLVLVGLILRSLWITIPEPDGKELQREQAPALFDLVTEIQTKLVGPKVHHIYVSDELNCGIVQIPSLGLFGWTSNYLVVGLPMLKALSPEEFRSVLAHEFGHLSGKHSRFTGWIYRVRQSWIQILHTVKQERSYASFLFEPFLNWYGPYFDAYSFVLRRAQEYEADVYSVELTGKQVAARALARLVTKERTLNEIFWPQFLRQSRFVGQPPRDTFVQMLGGLAHPISNAKAQSWFHQELEVQTGYDDSHPALADRLDAMGFKKESAESVALIDSLVQADERKELTADSMILELPEDFLTSLDRLWRERIVKRWRDSHQESQKANERLAQLDEKAKTDKPTIEELWEKVRLIGQTKELKDALPTINEILAQDSNHVGANFSLGTLLLEQNDRSGIERLELAMQHDPSVTMDACQIIYSFHYDNGDRELAETFRTRAQQYLEKAQRQYVAATTFSHDDRFEPHGLDEDVVEQLKSQLAHIYGLSTAYLARKVTDEMDEPIYVLGVVAAFTWQNGRNDRHGNILVELLANRIPFQRPLVFVALQDENFFLLNTLDRIPGAQIFATEDTKTLGVEYRN